MMDLVANFKQESLQLCEEMMNLLDRLEQSPDQRSCFREFGQLADRIYGTSKILILNGADDQGRLAVVANFTELEKLLGYKGAELDAESALSTVLVAFLMDATDLLKQVLEDLGQSESTAIQKLLAKTFFSRMEWINSQFDETISGSVPIGNLIEQLKKTEVS